MLFIGHCQAYNDEYFKVATRKNACNSGRTCAILLVEK